jgi:hypothetical protein
MARAGGDWQRAGCAEVYHVGMSLVGARLGRGRNRIGIKLTLAGLACLGALLGFQMPFREYPGMEYSDFPLPHDYAQPAEFVFARLMYPPHPYGMFGFRGGDWRHGFTSWTNDYPRADRHFTVAVRRLSRVDIRSVEQPVNPDDGDDIYNWPFLYEEGGAMALTDAQVVKLRDYLHRGGFLVLDDAWGTRQQALFEQELQQILPGQQTVEIGNDDPVFHTVFDLEQRGPIPGQWSLYSGRQYLSDGYEPHWRGIYDDSGRLMVALWLNVDTGDSWEWADDPRYPERYSAVGIRIGVNHIIYAMTH